MIPAIVLKHAVSVFGFVQLAREFVGYVRGSPPVPAPIPIVYTSSLSNNVATAVSVASTAASVLPSVKNFLWGDGVSSRLSDIERTLANEIAKVNTALNKEGETRSEQVAKLQEHIVNGIESEGSIRKYYNRINASLDFYAELFKEERKKFITLKIIFNEVSTNDIEKLRSFYRCLERGPFFKDKQGNIIECDLGKFIDHNLIDNLYELVGKDRLNYIDSHNNPVNVTPSHSSIEFMRKPLLEERQRILEFNANFDEDLLRKYQDMNERYLEEHEYCNINLELGGKIAKYYLENDKEKVKLSENPLEVVTENVKLRSEVLDEFNSGYTYVEKSSERVNDPIMGFRTIERGGFYTNRDETTIGSIYSAITGNYTTRLYCVPSFEGHPKDSLIALAKDIKSLTKRKEAIWRNRPFKDEIPQEEYNQEYESNRRRLIEIGQDLKLLREPLSKAKLLENGKEMPYNEDLSILSTYEQAEMPVVKIVNLPDGGQAAIPQMVDPNSKLGNFWNNFKSGIYQDMAKREDLETDDLLRRMEGKSFKERDDEFTKRGRKKHEEMIKEQIKRKQESEANWKAYQERQAERDRLDALAKKIWLSFYGACVVIPSGYFLYKWYTQPNVVYLGSNTPVDARINYLIDKAKLVGIYLMVLVSILYLIPHLITFLKNRIADVFDSFR